jgi:predicted DNA binding CopG/RHH family protein
MTKMKMKKKPHGGARKGAGRKPKEPTVVIRVPKSKLEAIKKTLLE